MRVLRATLRWRLTIPTGLLLLLACSGNDAASELSVPTSLEPANAAVPAPSGLPETDPALAPGASAVEPGALVPSLPSSAPEAAPVPEIPPEVVHPRRCYPPENIPENPTTVAEGVVWINSLLETHGAPLDLLCVLESFHRPLYMFATTSRLSAQPADGRNDPRLFLFTGDAVTSDSTARGAPPGVPGSNPVVSDPGVSDSSAAAEPPEFKGMSMSVVATGVGRPFLEFGELTAIRRSIKAEVEFPVEEPLQDYSPFESLKFGVVTTCGLCHLDEEPVFGIENAVESDAFRPEPQLDVPLQALYEQQTACDSEAQPDRCGFLDSILNHGDILPQAFPAEMPTIFERSREREIMRQNDAFRR